MEYRSDENQNRPASRLSVDDRLLIIHTGILTALNHCAELRLCNVSVRLMQMVEIRLSLEELCHEIDWITSCDNDLGRDIRRLVLEAFDFTSSQTLWKTRSDRHPPEEN